MNYALCLNPGWFAAERELVFISGGLVRDNHERQQGQVARPFDFPR